MTRLFNTKNTKFHMDKRILLNKIVFLFISCSFCIGGLFMGQTHLMAKTPQKDPLDLRNAGYIQQGTVEDLIKIRCGTDEKDAWTLWTNAYVLV